ncbi:MAG: gamma-glutamyl-gamma-aminobutyrate hydrolase family protein [Lachnospiraceae bacterium]|nr:gamma-glutamyl-gamma-aminobutyrate hydrolase family protein [Lachnospiraceae bacterium]
MKPLIGITCNYDYRDIVGRASGMGAEGQDWNFVAGDYVQSIEKAGGSPVLIPQCESFESLYPLLEKLDGILVTGGHDVGPERYGQCNKHSGLIIPERDAQDIRLVQFALEHEKPVLGICRGTQILNVACGGSLYQDLEKEGDFEHHFGDNYPRNYAWHNVTLSEGSILKDIYGTAKVQVNSIHHQAIREPGTDVTITAYSFDGVPEGIEVSGHKFVVGVQWHPEMMYDSAEQTKLFQAFLSQCDR